MFSTLLTTAAIVAAAPSTLPTVASGVVVDAATGQPVAGALVQQEGSVTSAFTKPDGSFRLLLDRAGSATLTVSGVGFDSGLMIGTVGAVIMSPTLSLLVLRAKGQLGHIGFLLAALLSGVGAAFGGLILGLAFVAFLTTRPSRLTGYALPAQTGHRAAI